MRFAANCHTKMAMWLAVLLMAVSLAAQSMLGCLPTKAFQGDIVGDMVARFQELAERCSRLEDVGSSIYDLILGSADSLP
jgi:hypothetical protein